MTLELGVCHDPSHNFSPASESKPLEPNRKQLFINKERLILVPIYSIIYIYI